MKCSNNQDLIVYIEQLEAELNEYKQAEEEGRLIQLPCAIGSIVYKITTQRGDFDDKEYFIIIQVPFRLQLLPELNKTIFLIEREAKEVLGRSKAI